MSVNVRKRTAGMITIQIIIVKLISAVVYLTTEFRTGVRRS